MFDADADEVAQGQRRELGVFLRGRRAALRPETVGLPAGARRHVKGLRREEVARLADVSIDWYTSLEQGRLKSIARNNLRRVLASLRLNSLETEHALSLAHDAHSAPVGPGNPNALLGFVRSYADGAAFAIDDTSKTIAWNAFADELFGFSSRPEGERRMLEMMVRDPRMQTVFVNWADTLEQMIGVFRSTYARSGTALDAFVRELRAASVDFDRLWRAYPVGSPTTHVCELRTPDGREVRLHFIAFRPVDHPTYIFVVLKTLS